MIAKRLPPVVTLCLSTLLAVVFALIFQPQVLAEIVDGNLFKGAMQSIYGETSVQTTNPMLTSLVATRGMQGMMNTIWLIICAMCFGGAMEAGGMVRSITRLFVRMIHGSIYGVFGFNAQFGYSRSVHLYFAEQQYVQAHLRPSGLRALFVESYHRR